MKILWHSNSPLVGSGYGVQSALTISHLEKEHNVIFSAFYGHRGAPFTVNNYKVIPGGEDAWGNDVLPTHDSYYRPDLIVLLMDLWVMAAGTLQQIGDKTAAWIPIDHNETPRDVKKALSGVKYPIAMSRHGLDALRAAGAFNATYIPLTVDTKVFKPLEYRSQLRKDFKWSGRYVGIMNSANKTLRKNIHIVIKAWADFVKHDPSALLYLHTMATPIHGGIDIVDCCEYYGLKVANPYSDTPVEEANVQIADAYLYQQGLYNLSMLNEIYNAGNVLIAPSRGEGFGIPVIEAQAAGLPVITARYTAQEELTGVGISLEPDMTEYTIQGSEQALVSAGTILRGIHTVYDKDNYGDIRSKARAFAAAYDTKRVYDNYWRPFLASIEAEREARISRTKQRLKLRTGNEHAKRTEQNT